MVLETVRFTKLEDPKFSFIDKLQGFLNPPFEKNLYLDSDTLTAMDISDIFSLLDRFEVAACHAPGYSGARIHPYESPAIPAAFVQFNTGVVAFRATPKTAAAFEHWQKLYLNHPEHIHDQLSFRQALFETDLALYVMPPEYNFLTLAGYCSGPVRILHNRGILGNPDKAIAVINQVTRARTLDATGVITILKFKQALHLCRPAKGMRIHLGL